MADRGYPTSTYRLQLHAGFGFSQAEEVVPYLSRLGVSHLYLSPVLQAAPDSTHGYDVVDHTKVSTDLGGETGLVALADAAHEHRLGIVVDVVPNHMAVPAPEYLNPRLWETLRLGRTAPHAHWFDVDWDRGDGRIGLPVLAGPLEEALAADELTLDQHGGETVLRYHDHCFPLAPGSDTSDLRSLVTQQHYELAGWRDRNEVLNYRRFFDVDTLIGVRVELEDVFDETHAILLGLYRSGVIDGFRIDHPDGLADPQAYLQRLRDRTEGAWIVVEKILQPNERLPTGWSCEGTTGYDAIRAIQGALVPAVGPDLDKRWRATGGEPSYQRTELGCKRLVLAGLLQPEVRRLASAAVAAASAAGESLSLTAAQAALTELLAHVDVYRAYVRLGVPADSEALARLDGMHERAVESRSDLAEPLDVVVRLLADTSTASSPGQDLVVRFQQVCGPVMAKGVEDTAFYRWHRLVGLNEVGGDPLALDAPDPGSLHTWARLQASHHPLGMTTLSTHDTKRDEDVRAALLAAPERLDGWDAVATAVKLLAATCDVDAPTAYLLAQTLLGAWPLEPDRLEEFMIKAVRESKQHTTWSEPNEGYESRVSDLALESLTAPVARALIAAQDSTELGVAATTLSSKLLQLTVPGIPDVYQGEEMVSPALVDPDNRRPVDYRLRETLLRRLDDSAIGVRAAEDLSEQKLWLVSRVLRLRRDQPDLFGASAGYEPLDCPSPHLLGFLRGGRLATLVTRWPGRLAETGWGDAAVALPPGQWSDVLTAATHEIGPDGGRCADLLSRLPVALLLRDAM
ncbi:MAG: (1-_4)-alpha-D-glucan 1-alpha-D-glucosylmutase [Nocardioidaceae bacterium]|jgi:(1->4)-alpha-D-glucan 1-alpha-D-glucosylmutase|nr:(1->4)-alpha-D-glucan 1-alpha-D-glucosylmutase [Nocardioidaceae bacterium]